MTTATQSRDVQRGVKVAAFVTLVAPLAGSVLFMAALYLRTLASEGSAGFGGIDLAGIGSFILFIGVFGFIMGGLPALMSGLLLGWHVSGGDAVSRLRAIATGLLGTVLGTGLLDAVLALGGSSGSVVPLLGLFLPLSAISALICRWMMLRIGLLLPQPPTSLAQH